MDPEQYSLMARVERDHWWYVGMRRLAAALLADAPPDGAPWRVLDAGCGTGGTTAWLRRYGTVVGVDLAAEAAPYWRERGLRAMARGSVAALPFATGRFDLATCFDVLYHQQVADEAAVLAELWRVLRPGGLLLLRVPAYQWLQGAHDAAVHTRRRYTRAEIETAVRDAGFTVVAATYGNCFLFPLAAAKRLSERWLGGSQVEMAVPSPAVNTLFRGALGLEARLAPRWPLPAGLSVFILGRKPAAAARAAAPAASPALAIASSRGRHVAGASAGRARPRCQRPRRSAWLVGLAPPQPPAARAPPRPPRGPAVPRRRRVQSSPRRAAPSPRPTPRQRPLPLPTSSRPLPQCQPPRRPTCWPEWARSGCRASCPAPWPISSRSE
jgi:SAM-dependent methyltransferase